MKDRRFRMLAIGVFFVLAITATYLFAQEAAGGGGGGEEGHTKPPASLIDLFMAAMPVSGVLVLLSVAGTALSIQYASMIKKEKQVPTALVVQTDEIINNISLTPVEEIPQDYNVLDEVTNVCQQYPESYYGKVLSASLARVEGGYDEMLRGLDEEAASATFNLQAKCSAVSLIGNLGPLIGLLGTVTGMISSFKKIAGMKAPTPADLSEGVYESLVNTTLGLIVAISFLTVFFFLKNNVAVMSLRTNAQIAELVGRLQNVVPNIQQTVQQLRQSGAPAGGGEEG